tara:strand:+ start:241 stop:501 length:261 start_codon:yes stop_codon:yes gene_type:complete
MWGRERKYSRAEIKEALKAVWSEKSIAITGQEYGIDGPEFEHPEPQDWEIQLIDRLRMILIRETLSSISRTLGIDEDSDYGGPNAG